MIVCLDNHVLVWGLWGLRGEGSPRDEGQPEDKILRAMALFEHLRSTKATVIIPAPVATEYLQGVPLERQPDVLEVLSKHFRVAPFDAAAAAIAAELWVKRNGKRGVSEEFRKRAGGAYKRDLKYDVQIVAIALYRKASVIYSEDPGVVAFAGNDIAVQGLPHGNYQAKLLLPDVVQPPSSGGPQRPESHHTPEENR